MEAKELVERIFPTKNGKRCSFVALSGKNGLRWILPANNPKISAVLDAWRPYGLISQIGWDAIRLSARIGALRILPSAKGFEVDLSASYWRNFGWEDKAPPLFAMYVGTPGPQQKLVVMLAKPETGTPKCVVKFPLGVDAWQSIVNEYEVLKNIKEEGLALAPEPMALNSNKLFTVQSWIDGRPIGIGIERAHFAFLESLMRPKKAVKVSKLRNILIERFTSLVKKNLIPADKMEKLKSLLEDGDWQGEVPATRIHGDFVPWNLKRQNDGSIAAIDWEESEEIGIPTYDLHYYKMQVEKLLGIKIRVEWSEYKKLVQKYSDSCEKLFDIVLNIGQVGAEIKIISQHCID